MIETVPRPVNKTPERQLDFVFLQGIRDGIIVPLTAPAILVGRIKGMAEAILESVPLEFKIVAPKTELVEKFSPISIKKKITSEYKIEHRRSSGRSRRCRSCMKRHPFSEQCQRDNWSTSQQLTSQKPNIMKSPSTLSGLG